MEKELKCMTEEELFLWIGNIIRLFPAYKFEDLLEMDAPFFMKISKVAAKILELEANALGKSVELEPSVEPSESANDDANLKGLLALYGVDIRNLENKDYRLNLSDLMRHQRNKRRRK